MGSAYAQDAESWDEEAEAGSADESSTEAGEEVDDGESIEESASTEDDAGVEEEESEPVAESDDSAATAGADDAPADEPAAPESAPEATAEAPPAPSPQDALQPPVAPRVSDKADRVREVLYQHTREILPELSSHEFKGSDSLRNLGANSVDRSEIIMMTLETLGLNVPLIELAKAENLDALAGLIASKMP